MLQEERKLRIEHKTWVVVFLFVVLVFADPFDCLYAIEVLIRAAIDSSVLVVFVLAVFSYVVVAAVVDPVGTALACSALMLPIQDWEWGGRPMTWLRKHGWALHVWLDRRKKLKEGFRPDDERQQLLALHLIASSQERRGAKLKQIRKIRKAARTEQVTLAADALSGHIEGKSVGRAAGR